MRTTPAIAFAIAAIGMAAAPAPAHASLMDFLKSIVPFMGSQAQQATVLNLCFRNEVEGSSIRWRAHVAPSGAAPRVTEWAVAAGQAGARCEAIVLPAQIRVEAELQQGGGWVPLPGCGVTMGTAQPNVTIRATGQPDRPGCAVS